MLEDDYLHSQSLHWHPKAPSLLAQVVPLGPPVSHFCPRLSVAYGKSAPELVLMENLKIRFHEDSPYPLIEPSMNHP
jgi:hypothetical protein